MIIKYNQYIKEGIEMKDEKSCILFINGFRHWLKDGNFGVYDKDEITSQILKQFGDEILYGFIDWKSDANQITRIDDIIKNNNVKSIVGFSAGGYVSFNLSNKYKIPALSINPAMASNCAAPSIQPIENNKLYPNQMVVIGSLDSKDSKGVDGNLVIDDLEKMNFEENGGEIYMIRNTHHLISSEQFNGVFKRFYKKYIM